MNDDTLSPSELIYLYLDGEADAVQHASLFAALAHDPELQTEFQDALQMRLSLSMEVRQTLPPPALKAALLQKAAVGTQVASEAGAGVGISQAVSKTAGSVFALVKSVLLPVLSAIAGAVIVTTGIATLGTSWVEQPKAVVTSTVTPLSEPVQAFSESSVPAERREVSETKNSVVSSYASAPLHDVATPVYKEMAVPPNDATEPNESALMELPPHDDTIQSDVLPVFSAAPLESSSRLPTEDEKTMRYMRSSIPEPFWFAESSEEYLWSVYGRGITGMQLFPWRQIESDGTFASDIALGVLYKLDEELAVGVEIGRETLPLYAVSNDNVLEPRSTIQWVGLSGRYIPGCMVLPGNIQPFITGFLGAAEFGPLAKSVLGIRWQPDAHIALSFGVEGTTLLYRYRQQWYNTQKLGVSYGVEVQF